ncbi:hypothetical protein SAMN05216474_0624 [Lishizhenia tianjinensis]|uniref:Uncharacterized protein n=1 Tax=Lishizhenia tianjinensis TaxID=477690 RepID=A0A1I6Y2T8_9FLAO|nr:DUF6686 family protein [Lishizhenia tianjinensis]SFT44828.1 hypothetical protein SAMN05216474_0624 [Lishizhenia tianjinensis]
MILIHENSIGSLAKCECCDKYSLRLGTVILPLSSKQMRELIYAFQDTLSSCFKHSNCKKYHQQTRVNFALNAAHMSLSLSKDEIVQSIELLEFSLLMIEVGNILVSK